MSWHIHNHIQSHRLSHKHSYIFIDLTFIDPFDLTWPQLTSFDLSWPHLTSFDFNWPHFMLLDDIWHLTSLDLIWPHLTSDLIWPHLTLFDVIWYYVTFNIILPHLTSLDLTWPHLTSFDLIFWKLSYEFHNDLLQYLCSKMHISELTSKWVKLSKIYSICFYLFLSSTMVSYMIFIKIKALKWFFREIWANEYHP